MKRLLALFLFLSAFCAPESLVAAPSTLIELNPVRVHVDRNDKIHVTYQKECGASFAGFVLRTSAEKELFVAVLSHRPNGRCIELMPMEEMVIPKLRGSEFAAVTSLNPSTEPVYLKLSPMQNFNQVADGDEFRFEAAYTSQCGTALGLVLYPSASGYELSVLEGRTTKFDNCNRTTKLVKYPHINLSGAPLRANIEFQEEVSTPPRYSLRRAQTRLVAKGEQSTLYYFRRCSEAPVGLIRQPSSLGTVLSVLLAQYPDVRCPEGAPERLWTPWPEAIRDKDAQEFAGTKTKKREQLLVKRPLSYTIEKGSLNLVAYGSCQNDIGILSRTSAQGYAVGILQLQSSESCNSEMKEVNFSFDWTYVEGVKRDIKPLQLVGF